MQSDDFSPESGEWEDADMNGFISASEMVLTKVRYIAFGQWKSISKPVAQIMIGVLCIYLSIELFVFVCKLCKNPSSHPYIYHNIFHNQTFPFRLAMA